MPTTSSVRPSWLFPATSGVFTMPRLQCLLSGQRVLALMWEHRAVSEYRGAYIPSRAHVISDLDARNQSIDVLVQTYEVPEAPCRVITVAGLVEEFDYERPEYGPSGTPNTT